MKKKILIISFISLLIDQIIKFIVEKFLTKLIVIPNFLKFIYTKNYGIAFSMLNGKQLFIIIFSIILILILIKIMYDDYLLKKEDIKYKNIMYGLLFGGIFSNLLDRIIRGYVVDFISLTFLSYSFAIFNIADICITFGVLLYIYDNFKK